jgi:hypothetical protein
MAIPLSEGLRHLREEMLKPETQAKLFAGYEQSDWLKGFKRPGSDVVEKVEPQSLSEATLERLIVEIGQFTEHRREVVEKPATQLFSRGDLTKRMEELILGHLTGVHATMVKEDHPVVDAIGRMRSPSPRHPMDLIRMVDGA